MTQDCATRGGERRERAHRSEQAERRRLEAAREQKRSHGVAEQADQHHAASSQSSLSRPQKLLHTKNAMLEAEMIVPTWISLSPTRHRIPALSSRR